MATESLVHAASCVSIYEKAPGHATGVIRSIRQQLHAIFAAIAVVAVAAVAGARPYRKWRYKADKFVHLTLLEIHRDPIFCPCLFFCAAAIFACKKKSKKMAKMARRPAPDRYLNSRYLRLY